MIDLMDYLIIFAVFIIVVITVRKSSQVEKQKKREKVTALFLGRTPLTTQQFYEKHYQALGVPFEIIEKVKTILEEVLQEDLSCLSVEDDFSQNLSFFWDFDSMADVELILSIEEEFGITISDTEAQKTHTIDDIIKLIVSKTKVP